MAVATWARSSSPGSSATEGRARRARELISTGELDVVATSPSGLAPKVRDNEHARRAIAVMLRSLAWLPEAEEVSRLREQGESLLVTIDRWSTEPPSPQSREDAMRRIASLHLGAVAAARAARERP